MLNWEGELGRGEVGRKDGKRKNNNKRRKNGNKDFGMETKIRRMRALRGG